MYEEIISKDRLATYKLSEQDSQDIILGRYIWNIKLSQSLYPAISILEVTLRNKINDTIVKYLKKDWLDENNSWFNASEVQKIQETKAKISKEGKLYTNGQLISQLTLGFWCNLFKKAYKPHIWNKPQMIERIFPNFDIKTNNRIFIIERELKQIQKLRNRIFHQEPVFNHPLGISNMHGNIVKVLLWLSVDAAELYKRIESFNDVYNSQFLLIKNK